MKKFLLLSMCLSSLSINFGSEAFALSIFESAAHAGNQSSNHHALPIYFPNLGDVNLVSAFMQEAFQRGKKYHDEEKLRQFFNEATKN